MIACASVTFATVGSCFAIKKTFQTNKAYFIKGPHVVNTINCNQAKLSILSLPNTCSIVVLVVFLEHITTMTAFYISVIMTMQ